MDDSVAGTEFSRNPQDYCPDPDGHFIDRKRRRDFPGGAIRRCIESGDAELLDNDYVKLTAEYMNWTFHMIVDPYDNYAISCYPDNDAWYKDHDEQ